jgi:ribosomal protein S18 acetylase RimI-like enzyme
MAYRNYFGAFVYIEYHKDMTKSKILDSKRIKQIVSDKDFNQLLRIQTDSLRELANTYTAEELQAWTNYIKNETARRYAAFENLGYTDENNRIVAFISWTKHNNSASIECLYILSPYRGQKIGTFLLQAAEDDLKDKMVHVRSTLNAQAFYEKNGYTLTAYDVSRAGFRIALLEKQL